MGLKLRNLCDKFVLLLPHTLQLLLHDCVLVDYGMLRLEFIVVTLVVLLLFLVDLDTRKGKSEL